MSRTGRPSVVRRLGAMAAVLLLAVPFALPAPALASKVIGLSNASFDFNVAPGQTGSGDLTVYNDGTEPIKVMVYASDQVTDAKGKVGYVAPSRDVENIAKSPASWIRIMLPASTKAIGNTPYLEMKPGDRVPVKFDFEVPPGVAPGDHQVLVFFEILSFPGEVKGSGSTISGRLGARIHLRVQGDIRQELTVRPFAIRGLVIGDRAPYSFVLRNDGNVDVPLQGTLTLLDGNDNEVAKSTVMTQTTVYSKTMSEQAGVLDVSSAGIGRFTAQLRIDYKRESADGKSADDSILVNRTVWVVPLWLAILVVAVVGVTLLWLSWLSWRSAVKAAERRVAAKAKETPAAAGVEAGVKRPRWLPWRQKGTGAPSSL